MEEDRPTPAEYVDALPSDAPCEVGSKFVENKFDELHCISSLRLASFQHLGVAANDKTQQLAYGGKKNWIDVDVPDGCHVPDLFAGRALREH